MSAPFPEASEEHISRERERARELRRSRWWQNRIAAQAVCHYCQTPLKAKDATMDHIVPIAQGGFSTKGNVVAACKRCNTDKRDRTAFAWIRGTEG